MRLPIAERVAMRRRLYALVDRMADRLLDRKGAESARVHCIGKIAFCLRSAPGLRSALWRQIHQRLNDL